jgi:hypothetical protein
MHNRLLGRAALLTVLLVAAACGSDDGTDPTATPDSTATAAASSSTQPATDATEPGCGVTLTEIQDLLDDDSGVTENSTPDPGRCNFTWNDGGPRGIDVAIISGGTAAFEVPAGYEPLDGYGDEAHVSSQPGRASAVEFVGDDLYAADVVADGAALPMKDLCLQVLALALD